MSTNRETAEPLTPEEERELRQRIEELTVAPDIGPGPWHPEGFLDGQMGWFDNPGGDSSFPNASDVGLLLNEVPRLLATLDAARAAQDVALPADPAEDSRWSLGYERGYLQAEADSRAAQDVAGREHVHDPYLADRCAGCAALKTSLDGGHPVTPPPDALRALTVEALERAWIEVESEDEAKGVVGRGRFIDRLYAALHAQGLAQSPDLESGS